MIRQPRPEMVNNGAGVACRPKTRAAFRLKAFETRPDALSIGPSDGISPTPPKGGAGAETCGPRELGAGEVGGQATDTLVVLCLPLKAKVSALRLQGCDGRILLGSATGFRNP